MTKYISSRFVDLLSERRVSVTIGFSSYTGKRRANLVKALRGEVRTADIVVAKLFSHFSAPQATWYGWKNLTPEAAEVLIPVVIETCGTLILTSSVNSVWFVDSVKRTYSICKEYCNNPSDEYELIKSDSGYNYRNPVKRIDFRGSWHYGWAVSKKINNIGNMRNLKVPIPKDNPILALADSIERGEDVHVTLNF